MADERLEDRDVVGREPHPGADLVDEVHAALAVVPGIALAEVVEECPDEEEVRAADPVGEAGGLGGGLAEVPVDGEAVVGVALRPVADGLPLRQRAGHQAPLVEGLDDGDGGRPGAEEPHEGQPGLLRPGIAERRRLHR